MTADAPGWYDYLFMKRPAVSQFKKGTMAFCGVHPVGLTYIAPLRESNIAFRQKWLDKVHRLGEKML